MSPNSANLPEPIFTLGVFKPDVFDVLPELKGGVRFKLFVGEF